MPFLLARQNYKCNSCGKTVEELITEAQEKEEQTGISRILPVLVQDHIDGDNTHDHGLDGSYCSNLQYICYPCNRRKNPHRINGLSLGMQTTRAKQDSILNKPPFLNWVHAFIIDNEHICYNEMLAGGGKHSNGSSEITLERYFKTELFTKANPTGKFQVFPYHCGATLCNGEHVCFRGLKPKMIIEEERKKLETEWNQKYSMTPEEWKYKFGAREYMDGQYPFVPKEEYIKQHLKSTLD
jgi:hypothetical protein